jgi:rubrerythrin
MTEFVDKAIAFEVDSAEFYRNLKGEDLPEKALELVEALAAQEESHAESLRGMSLDTDSDATLQFTPELRLSMPPEPKRRDLKSLFDVAIEREEKSARIYDFASDFASGKLKDLLVSLAEFEESHKRRLMLVRRDYLK